MSRDRLHANLMLGAAGATVLYWVDYVTRGDVKSDEGPVYEAFERAFPLADGYMAGAFVASAVLLRRGRAEAVPAGIAAGSAMVFLGLMDVLFDLQHGIYRKRTPQAAVEALINVGCLTFGPYTMRRLWRSARRLDTRGGA